MASHYDFIETRAIECGATFFRRITWKDVTGTPIDITGYAAHMQVRKSVTAPVALLDLSSVTGGGLILGGANGTIDMYLTNTQTTAIAARSGVYDLELTAPDGSVIRLIEGAIDFVPEVTR